MAATDKLFAGSIPEIYDRFLVPLIFESYARDLAERLARVAPWEILETAAGTGVLTRAIASRLPAPARIVATDLNQPMLNHAQGQSHDSRITWRQADALGLPFEDQSFDVVACQFGAMFLPEKVQGLWGGAPRAKAGRPFLFQRVGPNLRKRVCRCGHASAGDALSARPASLHGPHPARLSRCGKNPRGARGGGIQGDFHRDSRWQKPRLLAARSCDCLLRRDSAAERNRGPGCVAPGKRHDNGGASPRASLWNGADRRPHQRARDCRRLLERIRVNEISASGELSLHPLPAVLRGEGGER